ncbi:hypothetical protein EDM00_10585 [Ornithobacterium rhinotracheale]|uniref:hypothetical protein n=1 Tax=Ornithobacterium rhinotracheale TaxID=28251 RepID=UPI00129D07A4|nr:hypothetical protein [Ornithobacterium rhinotracheale]MRI64427.1 hypothetical protein [Ornithobacterium rhinotracheale]
MKPYTEQQIQDAKAKYPRCIREIEVYPADTNFDKDGTADQEPAYFLVKKPNKALVDMLGSKGYKDNLERANDAIIKNCVLMGDTELMENDASVYTGLLEQLAGMVQSSRVALKKV